MLTHFLVLELAHESRLTANGFPTWDLEYPDGEVDRRIYPLIAGDTTECYRKRLRPTYPKVRWARQWLASPSRDTDTKGKGLPLAKAAYLGSQGPDATAMGQPWVFDTMHWRDSSHFILGWLKECESQFHSSPKHLAYLYGFLCHMAADIILHPYVNTFAGYYDQQPHTNLHKFMEANLDCYVAQQYYYRENLADNPKGGWGQQAKLGAIALDEIARTFETVASKIFTPPEDEDPPSAKKFVKSVNICLTAMGAGYDLGVQILGAAGSKFDREVMDHRFRERGWGADRYIAWAVALTRLFWRAVETWLTAKKGPKRDIAFVWAVPNFNLDTGYHPIVGLDNGRLVLRHEHSWAKYRNLMHSCKASGWAPSNRDAMGKKKRNEEGEERFKFNRWIRKGPKDLPWDLLPEEPSPRLLS